MKDVYTKKRERDNTAVNITQEEATAIIANMGKEEQERQEAHSKVLTMYAADLDKYDEQIVKEARTKKQAAEIKKLIISRRNALHEAMTLTDDKHQREQYSHQIERAGFLIEKITTKAEYLPERAEPTLPPLTRVMTRGEQNYLFDQLTKQKYIDTDRESFYFAFGGTTANTFKKIKWMKSKQTLLMLTDAVTPQGVNRTQRTEIMAAYITDRKGDKIQLPRPKRHDNNADETNMERIITRLNQLEM